MTTLVVETGAGLTNSNSYISLADAEIYFADRLFTTTWDAATDATKNTALAWASRLLDEQMDWYGTIVSTSQAMRWPRYSVYDLDGNSLSYSEIPNFLSKATAELAAYLIAENRLDDDDTMGFKKLKVGPIYMEVDKYDRKQFFPKSVLAMILPYGTRISKAPRQLSRIHG